MTPKQAATLLRKHGPYRLGKTGYPISHDRRLSGEQIVDAINAIASEPPAVAKAREALLRAVRAGINYRPNFMSLFDGDDVLVKARTYRRMLRAAKMEEGRKR